MLSAVSHVEHDFRVLGKSRWQAYIGSSTLGNLLVMAASYRGGRGIGLSRRRVAEHWGTGGADVHGIGAMTGDSAACAGDVAQAMAGGSDYARLSRAVRQAGPIDRRARDYAWRSALTPFLLAAGGVAVA